MRHGSALLALLALTGCATELAIGEEAADSASVAGVPINDLVTYRIESITSSGPFDDLKLDERTVDLVDPDKILAIDICRGPFASGTLKLQLTDRQTLKVLELESTPGAVSAAKAGSNIATAVSGKKK